MQFVKIFTNEFEIEDRKLVAIQIRNVSQIIFSSEQTRVCLSHEMRTPFGLIQTLCDLLKDQLRSNN
jgi:hypothetical protein